MADEKEDLSCFKFQQDFDTGAYLPQPLGRLTFGHETMRVYFHHKGMIGIISQRALDSGAMVVVDDRAQPVTEWMKTEDREQGFEDLQLQPFPEKEKR